MNLQLTRARVEEILRLLPERRIVVLGDLMLDEFVWGNVSRISPEAPVPVVDVTRESVHLGGAANVLANLMAFGAKGSVVGVIGSDAAGRRISAELVDCNPEQPSHFLLVDANRPTTVKTRIIAHSQLVVRADREHRQLVNGQVQEGIMVALEEALANADALVISDYDKGVVTPQILAKVLPMAYGRIPVLIDPKIRNFASYRPATLVTPNHLEALRMSNLEEDSDKGLHLAARRIHDALGCDAVLITRGDRGMLLLDQSGGPVFVETAAREVYDVTGAGDTVIAALASALSAGASYLEAAHLANHAAGIVVGKVGTATASRDELQASFE